MEARSIHEAAGVGEVIALGSQAGQKREKNFALLGHLFWCSLSEADIRREDLLSAMGDAGLEERLAPGEISAHDAFSRATGSLARRRIPLETTSQQRLFGTDRRHANLLIRDVRSRGGAPVRQVVRELVDSVGVTLEHEPVIQLELIPSSEELQAFPLILSSQLLGEESRLLEEAGETFEFARTHHDAGAARSVVRRALAEASPVSVRPSGGVYFVPITHEPKLKAIERFVGELKDRLGEEQTQRTEATTLKLVDAEEEREKIAIKLDEQVSREAASLVTEMGGILKAGKKITERRHADFIGRVRALKASVSEYEELLERKITGSRADLDLAQREAVNLLTQVEVKPSSAAGKSPQDG